MCNWQYIPHTFIFWVGALNGIEEHFARTIQEQSRIISSYPKYTPEIVVRIKSSEVWQTDSTGMMWSPHSPSMSALTSDFAKATTWNETIPIEKKSYFSLFSPSRSFLWSYMFVISELQMEFRNFGFILELEIKPDTYPKTNVCGIASCTCPHWLWHY